jgi:type VI protein secretion system component VasA
MPWARHRGSRVPVGASSVLSITLDKLSPQMSWQAILSEPLSVYLDGEASQISALREVLCNKALAVMVQWQPHHPWQMPPATVDGRDASAHLARVCRRRGTDRLGRAGQSGVSAVDRIFRVP